MPKILNDLLREYQIRNNSYVSSRQLETRNETPRQSDNKNSPQSLEKKYGSISTVEVFDQISENFAIVRIKKPATFSVESGSSVLVSIPSEGSYESRVLSVANSPNQPFLEFAVKMSDSKFKQLFSKLKKEDFIYVKSLPGRLAFDTEKPMVMLATGIGITPFRSVLQFARDTHLKTPMWLVYGNRNEIPFHSEIESISSDLNNLQVNHTLSQPPPDWKGRSGRIDKALLSSMVKDVPSDAKYYIVGSSEMIADTKAHLLSLGIDENSIVIEAFYDKKDSNQSKKEDENETVCFCYNVKKNKIQELVSLGHDKDEIMSLTNAGTGCGGCCDKLNTILRCE